MCLRARVKSECFYSEVKDPEAGHQRDRSAGISRGNGAQLIHGSA